MANNQFGFYKLNTSGPPAIVTSTPISSSSSSSSQPLPSSSGSTTVQPTTSSPPSTSAAPLQPTTTSTPASSSVKPAAVPAVSKPSTSAAPAASRSGPKTGLITNDLTPEEREELRIAKAIEAQATRTPSDTKPVVEAAAAPVEQPKPRSGENWREKREREEREKAERAEREARERAQKLAAIEQAAVEAQQARDAQANTGWSEREVEISNKPNKEIDMDPRKWSPEEVSIWLQKQGASSELRAHLFKNQISGEKLLTLEPSSPLLPTDSATSSALLQWVEDLRVGVENLIAMGL